MSAPCLGGGYRQVGGLSCWTFKCVSVYAYVSGSPESSECDCHVSV